MLSVRRRGVGCRSTDRTLAERLTRV